jgi:dTDP-D-glucose 4,6-dehydratase
MPAAGNLKDARRWAEFHTVIFGTALGGSIATITHHLIVRFAAETHVDRSILGQNR